jgi:hypothetical protein
MLKFLAVAVSATLIAAAPAFAADPAPAAPSAPTVKPGKATKADKPKVDASEKLICTREEDTGSFLAKRVCRTQAQIDSDRRAVERLDDDRQLLGNRPGPGGGLGPGN